MHFDETFRLMEERGGAAEARAAAKRFWTTTDDAAIADYMRVCMPFYNPPGGDAEVQAQARRRAILRGDTMRHFATGEMRTMDARASLAKIACPTLVTVGDYDPITPVVCSHEIVAAMQPGLAQLEIFEGAGHGVHRDQPEAAERAMRAFLAA
jgi:proline iminopeptidase